MSKKLNIIFLFVVLACLIFSVFLIKLDMVKKPPDKTAQEYRKLAKTELMKAITIYPMHVKSMVELGNIYSDEGNYHEAIRWFSTVIKLTSTYGGAYYNRGNAYYNQGNYHKAINDYNNAIAIKNKQVDEYFNYAEDYGVDIYVNRGSSYYKIGRMGEAINDFKHAIVIDNNNLMAHNNLKIALWRINNAGKTETD